MKERLVFFYLLHIYTIFSRTRRRWLGMYFFESVVGGDDVVGYLKLGGRGVG